MKVLIREAGIVDITTCADGDTLVNLSLLLTPESGIKPVLSRRDLSEQILAYLIKMSLEVKQSGKIEIDEVEYDEFMKWKKTGK